MMSQDCHLMKHQILPPDLLHNVIYPFNHPNYEYILVKSKYFLGSEGLLHNCKSLKNNILLTVFSEVYLKNYKFIISIF